MSSTPSFRRAARAATAAATAALLAVTSLALAAPAAAAADTAVTDAVFRWGINAETHAAAYAPGTYNLISAGVVDMASASDRVTTDDWQQSAGAVSILKTQTDGSLVPATFAGLRTDAAGTTTTTGNGRDSGHVVEISDGAGTVDPESGTAEIQWTGTFTVAYYSGMTRFWVKDPLLTVEADGTGTVTATLGGWGTSMEDPEKFEVLTPVDDVPIATLTDVEVDDDGFTVTPDYLGVTVPQADQVTTGAQWGAFPPEFVDFQTRTGQTQYWYSSGGLADARKPARPLTVAYEAAAAVAAPEITTQPTAASITTGETAAFTVEATGTAPTYRWQRSADGDTWTDIDGASAETYELVDATTADSGAAFRVVVANAAGEVTSDAASLTVTSEPIAVAGAQLEWAYSGYAQAGVFGAWWQEAEGENVAVVSLDAAAVTGDPTKAGTVYRGVRFDGGTGEIDPETGAGTLTWTTGTWTLNAYRPAYDIAPDESLANPVLTIDEDGTGTLSVDASLGEHIDFMSGTNAIIPATGPERVVIATFARVDLEDGVLRITPDFAGRAPTVPEGESPYNACDTTPGAAGSWPQSWLDFVGSTVRAHYYTTSCSGLNLTKAPFAFTVDTAASEPVLVTQPTSVDLVPGSTATFRVVAEGNPNPAIRWQERRAGGAWTDIPGATAGAYSFVVTDSDYDRELRALAGSVASDVVAAGRNAAPVIRTQAANAQGVPGGSATFAPVIASALPLSYQWQSNPNGAGEWTDMPGETGASFTVTGLVLGDTRYYRVIATNDAGTVTSLGRRVSALREPTAPTITQQPIDIAVFEGGSRQVSLFATGFPNVTYQVERQDDDGGWSALTAAASTLPVLSGLTLDDDDALLRVAVSNQGASPTVYSDEFTLDVVPVDGHTVHVASAPSPFDATVGGTASVGLGGFGDLTSRRLVIFGITESENWDRRDELVGQPVSTLGSNVTLFSAPNLVAAGGEYWQSLSLPAGGLDPEKTYVAFAMYADLAGNVGDDRAADAVTPFVLAGQSAPTIATQPASTQALTGAAATLTASATGEPAPRLQWETSVDGAEWTAVDGATDATLEIEDVTATAQYRLVATSALGTAVSDAATVTALPVPTITVSKTEGLDPDGETVTVIGTGFLPNPPATTGTGRPLTGFGGLYVAFGKFPETWEPTKDAAGTTRANRAGTKWVVAPEDVDRIGGTAAGAVAIGADGSFEVEIPVASDWFSATGEYGVYTYAGGGAKYAPFETFTPVTLVEAEPEIVDQPDGVEVLAGRDATLEAVVTGGPTPTLQWERSSDGGAWTEIDGATSATLELVEVAEEARYRLVATNGLGSVTSEPATVTVVTSEVLGETATFEWAINAASQGTSFNGACSFFVAGIADGTEASYRSVDGDVVLIKRGVGGQAIEVTAENRCLPIDGTDGAQRVLFTNGLATRDADGVTTVRWQGAFTIYSYGGLVPWYVKDPTLTIGTDGTGEITAELGGFASSMTDPNVKEPLAPETGMTILELEEVSIDAQGVIDATPVYAGVDYFPLTDPKDPHSERRTTSAIPDYAKRANPDWGSWPTDLVDFHYRTGLSSYWHTSGLSADASKPPAPVGLALAADELVYTPFLPVAITAQPGSVDVVLGADAEFEVVATGGDALTYQWQLSRDGYGQRWEDIPDGTEARLVLDDLAETTEYPDHAVRVLVSNGVQRVASDAATLRVRGQAPVTVISQPTEQITHAGGGAYFYAYAEGFPFPTYQWQVSADGGATWTDVGEARTDGYYLTLDTTDASQDGALYRALVGNGTEDAVATDAAKLTVLPAEVPTISIAHDYPYYPYPIDPLLSEEGDNFLYVRGGGLPWPSTTDRFRIGIVSAAAWAARDTDFGVDDLISSDVLQTDGNVVNGAWGPAAIPIAYDSLEAGTDYVAVTISATAGDRTYDSAVPIQVVGQAAPTAEVSASAASVLAGGDVTLTATITGTPAPTVQWQRRIGAGEWTDVAGATASVLAAPGLTGSTDYRVVATNGLGRAVSEPVAVTVLPVLPVPTVTVSKTDGLAADGETVVVRGAGFLANPPATSGTRPPLRGAFGGVYVAFGKFADEWKASAGAPASARAVIDSADTRWVVAPEDVDALGSAAVAIEADGSFEVELRVRPGLFDAEGTYGVYTYPGSGAVYAPFETATPVTFDESAPTITDQPDAVTAPASPVQGDPVAVFRAAVAGAPAPALQWQRTTEGGTWTDIAGATGTELALPYAAADSGTAVRLVARNGLGTATSEPALLTVGERARVVSGPVAATVDAGDDAVFAAEVAGTDVAVRWESLAPGAGTWSVVRGETSTTLTVAATRALDGTRYRVVATSPIPGAPGGSSESWEVSAPAVLTVRYAAITVTTQPQDVYAPVPVRGSAEARFTVAAEATPEAAVQWQRKVDGSWESIDGATAATLALRYAGEADAAVVRAVLTTALGEVAVSHEAALAIGVPVSIAAQPASVTAVDGSTVAFTVGTAGTVSGVQWQQRTAGGWIDLDGATGTTLETTASVDAAYRAVVTGPFATETAVGAPLGSVAVSDEAALRLVAVPVFTTSPTSVLAPATPTDGSPVVTFTATASGTPAPSLTWSRLGADGAWAAVGEGTTLSYRYGPEDAGAQFRATATNEAGSVHSEVVELTLGDPASASIGATAITVRQGDPLVIDGLVGGTSAVAAWQVLPAGADAWIDLEGADAATLEVADDAVRHGQQYRVAVSSPVPATVGGAASVAVSEPVTVQLSAPAGAAADIPVDELGDAGGITVVSQDGRTVTVFVGTEHAGRYVGMWVRSTPRFLGWHLVAADGTVSVALPADLEAGAHRLIAVDGSGALLGWAAFEVAGDGTIDALPATGADAARLGGLVAGGVLLALLGALALVGARRRRSGIA